jgi:hypothetical protein
MNDGLENNLNMEISLVEATMEILFAYGLMLVREDSKQVYRFAKFRFESVIILWVVYIFSPG